MRLLRTDKLQIVEFQGPDVPPYAILSHTWAEEEVSFKDVQQGLAQSRRGHEKVAGACSLAIEDGFEYIWIDTCCIDKTSSAELSEAINSMFKLYGDAEVCYAYLSDVDVGGANDGNAHDLASSFKESRWFTRGWTLQELIAPGVVYFYGAGWKQIGSRETLLDLIVDVTKISAAYFATGDLTQFSAAQKMSWAANRTTTRPEDEAYCLLGIFDINMPLLYGEGRRAFQRLQEEILRQSEDDSLFSHNHQDVLAASPWWFRYCNGVSRRKASQWPYKNNPSLILDRNLSLNRSRITMSFPVVRVSEFELLGDFCSVSWPSGRARVPCYLALLNCGTSESTATLVLHEQSPGVYVKVAFPTRGVVRAAWKPKLAQRVTTMTLSISRASTAPTRGAWGWRSRNQNIFFGGALQHQVRTDVHTAQLRPIMSPIVRPALQVPAVLSEDGLRDKVIIKGPCRLTSGFSLQYVYVAGFRVTWLERGGEVHLLPSDFLNMMRPCVVFSTEEKNSFMVVLEPTRASVNAKLYTDIPPWEGQETLAYMARLEAESPVGRCDSPCYHASQRVSSLKTVEVQVRSRRRDNGWWVYVSVT